MPKLYSSAQIIKALLRRGFIFISQRGSHVKLRKAGKETLTVIIPAGRKEIPLGTFRSIIRQAKVDKSIFE